MRTKSYLLLSLLMCLCLAGCTDDNGAANPSNNGSNNGNDAALSDASDVAADAGGEDASEDTTSGECTVDNDCNGQPNQVGFCETSTGTCTYTCDDGYADCDADPSNGCEIDLNADAANCGTCGTTCEPTLNQQAICSAGTCDVDPDECTDGFVDLNGQAGDGCECELTDENDVPDADGNDTNCDGVDGVVDGEDANIVFVAPDGDDTADGLSAATAVKTLTVAIGIADDQDRPFVLAAGGSFAEQVELANGVSIYGGYDAANDWARDTDNQATKIAPTTAEFDASEMHYKTVVAVDIDQPTTLDHLTIEGVDASGLSTGASTYALWANNADALTVDHSVIVAGEAAAGADGTDATSGADRLASGACTPADGGHGATADAAEEACSSAYNGQHANAGLDGDLADISNSLGTGGLGGIHHCNENGTAGDPGRQGPPGDDGTNGQALADGTGSLDADGHWTLGLGTSPTYGENGGGGGGGGAGGNYQRNQGLSICTTNPSAATCSAVGGNGGDGGDGGCAATGSTNGEAGGGSFGVAIIAGTLTITDTTITLGAGGRGGVGGDGAAGDWGVPGSSNGSANTASGGASGPGGLGGEGGNGGDAGAGAGGCGGASFGVMTAEGVAFTPDASVTIDDSNASAATGGNGGEAADGSFAPDGCDGEVAQTYAYTAP